MTIQQTVAADPKAQTFNFDGVPTISSGRFTDVRGATEGLTARIKVYAEGGENVTHTHLAEPHMFFIISGEATFELGRNGEEEFVAGPNHGVLLPKGAFYSFGNSGKGNLVMLRIGDEPGDYRGRFDPDGRPLRGDSIENGHAEAVVIPGEFFTGK